MRERLTVCEPFLHLPNLVISPTNLQSLLARRSSFACLTIAKFINYLTACVSRCFPAFSFFIWVFNCFPVFVSSRLDSSCLVHWTVLLASLDCFGIRTVQWTGHFHSVRCTGLFLSRPVDGAIALWIQPMTINPRQLITSSP